MCISSCTYQVSRAASYVDFAMGFVPGVSTVTSGIHLAEKVGMNILLKCGCLKKSSLEKSCYYNKVRHTPAKKCAGLMIPGINIVIAIATAKSTVKKIQEINKLAKPHQADEVKAAARLPFAEKKLEKRLKEFRQLVEAKNKINLQKADVEKMNAFLKDPRDNLKPGIARLLRLLYVAPALGSISSFNKLINEQREMVGDIATLLKQCSEGESQNEVVCQTLIEFFESSREKLLGEVLDMVIANNEIKDLLGIYLPSTYSGRGEMRLKFVELVGEDIFI